MDIGTDAKALLPSAPTLSIGPSIPGEAFATLGAAGIKLIDDIFTFLTSPAMLAADKNQDIQALVVKWDGVLKQAQATGDISKVDEESSG